MLGGGLDASQQSGVMGMAGPGKMASRWVDAWLLCWLSGLLLAVGEGRLGCVCGTDTIIVGTFGWHEQTGAHVPLSVAEQCGCALKYWPSSCPAADFLFKLTMQLACTCCVVCLLLCGRVPQSLVLFTILT